MNLEAERAKFIERVEVLEKRAKEADEYEHKLEDMDLLLEELELKNEELKAMEDKLQECLEFEKMVEELAEELFGKEQEIYQISLKIKELEEMNAV